MSPLGVLGEVEVAFSVWLPERGGWSFEVSYLESTKGGVWGGGISQPSTTKAQIEISVLEITLIFAPGQDKDDRAVR